MVIVEVVFVVWVLQAGIREYYGSTRTVSLKKWSLSMVSEVANQHKLMWLATKGNFVPSIESRIAEHINNVKCSYSSPGKDLGAFANSAK